MKILSQLLSRFCIPLIVVISLFVNANLKWGEHERNTIVISDGKGYYAYLPAVFIYQDLNMNFFDSIEEKYYDENTRYDYRSGANNKTIDKYFAGVALMQLPFFLAGHVVTLMSDEPVDGYSKWYVILTSIGALFWLVMGLIYLRKFLHLHGAKEGLSAFILFILFFGTNLFYYTIVEPTMSHVYCFALVSMFLYFGKKWISTGNTNTALAAAFLFGLIFLVRPVNALVGLWLIYEAGGFLKLFDRKKELFKAPAKVVLSLVLLALPFTLQLLIWKIQTGSWIVNSYGDEGFHFFQPHMFDFLFSYKKGLFVYLPITFVALLGLIPLWKKDRKRALIAFAFFLIVFYVLSSWWMWYYGGSFGTRVIIEFLPILALLLYFFLNSLSSMRGKFARFALLVILTVFCQFQTYQYRYYLIHWSDMTSEKYWDVFGKLP